jgi:Peptidase A4 family
MRKSHVAGAAVAALSLVLTASAFSSQAGAATGAGPGYSIQPGQPMVAARGNPAPPISAANGSGTIESSNWAGYAAAHPGTSFRYVQATFFVPYVDCASTPNAFSSHWVGFDGLNSRTVEQLGVEAGCAGPNPQYYAWYEMYPGIESSVFFVSPGNSIVASAYYNGQTKMFVLTLDDTTTGQHFTRSLRCAASSCGRSSAEAISESPSDSSGRALPLANYHACSFSDVTVTDSLGHRGTLRSAWWNTFRIIEVGGTSDSVAGQPTSLFQGRAFSNYWFRED